MNYACLPSANIRSTKTSMVLPNAVEPPPQSEPSQTRDYIDDLNRTFHEVYDKVQETFKRIDPILRAVPAEESSCAPQREPETLLNKELHELLNKLRTMNQFLEYNIKRISI